jgi:hypothetical protein
MPRVKQLPVAVKQPAVKQPAAAGGYIPASEQDKPTLKPVGRTAVYAAFAALRPA